MDRADSIWERVKQQVIDGYSSAVEKADELARVGHRKLDSASIRRHIGREMMTLGGRVFHLIEDGQNADIAADDVVLRSLERIRNLEKELEEKEREIEEIRKKVPDESDEGASDTSESVVTPDDEVS